MEKRITYDLDSLEDQIDIIDSEYESSRRSCSDFNNVEF